MARRGSRGSTVFEGPVQRTARGAGFFRLPSRDDGVPPAELFIKASDMHGAFDGDTVRVRMTGRRRGGGSRCGEVVSVLERAKTRFVGRYFERDGRGLVRHDPGPRRGPRRVGIGHTPPRIDGRSKPQISRARTTAALKSGPTTA